MAASSTRSYFTEAIDILATATVMTENIPMIIGNWTGVPAFSAAVGEDGELMVEGIYELDVTAVATPAQGDFIYIVSGTNALTKTVSTNRPFGRIVYIAGTHGMATGSNLAWIKLYQALV